MINSAGAYVARLIRMTARDVAELVDRAAVDGGKRLEGAGITTLDEWMRMHQHAGFIYGGVFDQSIDMIERHLRLCDELAESMAQLLESGPVSASPIVLERSLGEAIMRIAYTLDPSVPPARTVLRMAAYQLDSVEGTLTAARTFGRYAKEEETKAMESIKTLHKLLSDAGFERLPDKREPLTATLSLNGQRENLRFNATDAYRKYAPSSPWMWEMGSGVTHSRGWMLDGLMPTLRAAPITSPADVALSVATSVVELSDVLARTAHAHTGTDVDWFLKRNHLRRMGIASSRPGTGAPKIGHVEYAGRGPEWVPKRGSMGPSFIKARPGEGTPT